MFLFYFSWIYSGVKSYIFLFFRWTGMTENRVLAFASSESLLEPECATFYMKNTPSPAEDWHPVLWERVDAFLTSLVFWNYFKWEQVLSLCAAPADCGRRGGISPRQLGLGLLQKLPSPVLETLTEYLNVCFRRWAPGSCCWESKGYSIKFLEKSTHPWLPAFIAAYALSYNECLMPFADKRSNGMSDWNKYKSQIVSVQKDSWSRPLQKIFTFRKCHCKYTAKFLCFKHDASQPHPKCHLGNVSTLSNIAQLKPTQSPPLVQQRAAH